VSSEILQTTLTESAVRQISAQKSEPEWLLEKRLSAWKFAQTVEMPDWSRGIRGWWNSAVKELDINTLLPYAPARNAMPQLDKVVVLDEDENEIEEPVAGTIIQYNSEVVKIELSAEAQRAGVILTSLDKAVQEHPELVQKYFMNTNIKPEETKITALHAAFWSGGVFLYAPKDTKLEHPFRFIYYTDVAGLATFSHTLIVTEANCEIKVLEEHRSNGSESDQQGMDSNVVEIFTGANSVTEYYNPQEWGENISNFSIKRALIGRNGLNRWFIGLVGSETTRMNLEGICVAEGARTEMTGAFCPNHHQHFDVKTISKHTSTRTTGDALIKAALNDASHYGFQGVIRVDKPGKFTDSFLQSHILYLSGDSKADAMPSLDVEANDVRCMHGQTIGMVNEDQLYYLQTRGLSRAEATHLIVTGFFAPVVERIPLESVRQRLREAIDRKMGF
jgi:Fe-S cluster assembly protein SufD